MSVLFPSLSLLLLNMLNSPHPQVFDKVILLYEGLQIYFGPASSARQFFTSRGWYCPPRQTPADFLTSLTTPAERVPFPGWEDRVPRTAVEFAREWRESEERAEVRRGIEEFERRWGGEGGEEGEGAKDFRRSRDAMQAGGMYVLFLSSSYIFYLLIG